ncbi:uridine phosphorylase [Paraferrimonas sp. SM1919]|uniref:uridine phosphorylase n=1 Tax=Paraferrimonas sp. SM1919 TaxID=2662263 RepID=UPI0013D67391|nr:uridine phosphorylase [Paraferrimonas sp. SM1919]
MTTVFHLGLDKAMLEGATLAIIPGDPGRVAKIAAHLDAPKPLASIREYTSYLGYLNGKAVVVCSTGIGGPSTSIAVEELAQLGVNTFLRVGTTGGIQPQVRPGDMIVSQASVRLDGASLHFAPLEYPAVADFDCTTAMVKACKDLGFEPHVGVTASSDTFYPGQERYDTFSGRVTQRFQGSLEQWQQMGVLNYEMESATLFTMCASQGLRAACVAGVLVNRGEQEIPDEAKVQHAVAKSVEVVVAAAKALI